ncbi:MAG TPA: hypothetical protein VHD60_01360 [Candidatus Saccharimonadales bacterium]|nr:hypothetical protein [Candidatus Saccharimonadales bacterium]
MSKARDPYVNPEWQVHNFRAHDEVPALVSDTWWGSFRGLLELSSLRRPLANTSWAGQSALNAGRHVSFVPEQVVGVGATELTSEEAAP